MDGGDDDAVIDLRLDEWDSILEAVRSSSEHQAERHRIARRWALVEAFSEWSHSDPARFHESVVKAETMLDQLEAATT